MTLSKSDYTDLWLKHFRSLPSAPTMPNYDEYVIRENMLEDYLDIFRGKNTRKSRTIKPCKWYYEHPFFDEKDKRKELEGVIRGTDSLSIKYILIAEVAPSCFVNSIKDLIYIYNVKKDGGKCLSEPLKAFGVINYSSLTQIKRLLRLASEGVLILDLFPFSLSYSPSIRKKLNYRKATNSFFDDSSNPYSIINRINKLKKDKDLCLDLYKSSPNACFIAPPTISHHLAGYVNAKVCSFLKFKPDIDTSSKKTKYLCEGNSAANYPNYRYIYNALF